MAQILNYEFEGPYPLAETVFNEVPAVYFISDDHNSNLDVGQTDNLKTRLASHDRMPCWRRNAKSRIVVYVLQVFSGNQRLAIESRIRSSFNFCCGIV